MRVVGGDSRSKGEVPGGLGSLSRSTGLKGGRCEKRVWKASWG